MSSARDTDLEACAKGLACPFCADSKLGLSQRSDDEGQCELAVLCLTCKAVGPFVVDANGDPFDLPSPEHAREAIKAWNKRAVRQ